MTLKVRVLKRKDSGVIRSRKRPYLPAINVDMYTNYKYFQEDTERLFIEAKLCEFEYNMAKTAREIGIERCHLYNLCKKYQIVTR